MGQQQSKQKCIFNALLTSSSKGRWCRADLSEYVPGTQQRRAARYCDVSAQTITVTTERTRRLGLQFSRATYRGYLAILLYAPLKRRGPWAFMRPLEMRVRCLASSLCFACGVIYALLAADLIDRTDLTCLAALIWQGQLT